MIKITQIQNIDILYHSPILKLFQLYNIYSSFLKKLYVIHTYIIKILQLILITNIKL